VTQTRRGEEKQTKVDRQVSINNAFAAYLEWLLLTIIGMCGLHPVVVGGQA
jgi:hypothetical protein